LDFSYNIEGDDKLASADARCPNCSSPIRPRDVYCEICGIKLGEHVPPEVSVGALRSLEGENLELRRRLRKATRRPSRMAGILLSALGLASLSLAIFYESNILAFIGLGLAFWGAILLFVRTTHYVKGQLLESTARPYYTAIERLLDHLEYDGTPTYLPPKQLKALKGGTIFISAEKGEEIDYQRLSNELQVDRLFSPNPLGVLMVAPGVGLANLLEEEVGKDFTRASLKDLQRDLPPAIIEGFELAEGVETEVEGDVISVKITKSLYRTFYEEADERLKRIGCPLVSAIALALTRSTDKPIFVQDVQSEPEGSTMTIHYLVLGGAGR
jgi:hypothetical protein